MLLRIHNVAGLEQKVVTRGTQPGLVVYRSGWRLFGVCLVVAGPWRPIEERIALCGPGRARAMFRWHWSVKERATCIRSTLRSWPAFPQGGAHG